MARNLNKIMLIGNLTKDPELKYTPSGSAVVNFTIATNRQWKDSSGNEHDEANFTRCVAWSKLAEIIDKYLFKGKKVYVDGRISNKSWEDRDGVKHYMTEVVVDNMIMLGSKSDDYHATETPKSTGDMFESDEHPPEP